MDAGTVYWVTGLSGAGKTTVGSKLYNSLREKKSNVVMLDGDILRGVFQIFDYSTEGRKSLAFQYSRLCRMLSDQGIDVVICTIAMYDEVRVWNRKNISSYVEIYLEVSLEELRKRDQKGLYSSETQNVVGATAAVELPKNPDIVIRNYGETTADKALKIILNKINKKCDNYAGNQADEFMMSEIDREALENICFVLNCKESEIENVRVLRAGLTNTSFLFELRGKKYVYRSGGKESAETLTDRRTEAYAQRVAEKIGIDKSVIYIDESGWKVSHFIESKEFSMRKNDEDLKRGMESIRKLHDVEVVAKENIREFDNYEDGMKLFEMATAKRKDLRDEYDELLSKVYIVYQYAVDERKKLGRAEKVLCHNDVYESNCIFDGNELYLIDWEYAGINDPANDLACVLCREIYTDEEICRYMTEYYGHTPTKYEKRHMYAYIVLCGFYWFAWGMYKGKSDNDAGFFYENAYENLTRFIDIVINMYKEDGEI